MSGDRLRVLCIDHEGGHGGASRSLYQSLRNLDRDDMEIEVWGRRPGPIKDWYSDLGIVHRLVSQLPALSSQPRTFDNCVEYPRYLARCVRAAPLIRKLSRDIERRFDVVHFNHEGLWLTSRWLRSLVAAGFTMHIRTRLVDTPFARWQNRTISRTMDHLVFITENEREHFVGLGGTADGSVIYNSPPPIPEIFSPHADIPRDGRLKIASLSNFSMIKGVDRLAELAAEFAANGEAENVLFVLAGDMHLTKRFPGRLGELGAKGGKFSDYVRERGLDHMFLFLGHVSDPERVLASCDMAAKLTRGANPWGRDIIEALWFERPVIALGKWNGFVEDGRTGLLKSTFDAPSLAREIVRFFKDRDALAAMGRRGRERIDRLCNGADRAAELLEVWRSVARARASA